jgi:gas vesicle protein
MTPEREKGGLDTAALGWGFVIGLLVGGIGALFKAPKHGMFSRSQLEEAGHNLRSKLESVVPTDPIAESIAEGKAAARHRRAQLGLER